MEIKSNSIKVVANVIIIIKIYFIRLNEQCDFVMLSFKIIKVPQQINLTFHNKMINGNRTDLKVTSLSKITIH